MKCVVCNNEVKKEINSIICSDKCSFLRTRIIRFQDKHYPTNGCDNCRGDLRQSCSVQCKKEFKESHEFGIELWSIVHLIYKMQ